MIDIDFVIDNKIYYKCSYCNYDLGGIEEIPEDWGYCPKCGYELKKDDFKEV